MLCVWKQNKLKDNYKKVETKDLHISLKWILRKMRDKKYVEPRLHILLYRDSSLTLCEYLVKVM